jgi:hypothetical protein
MGTWNNKINGNDTFQDVYQNFFDLYNQGQNPKDISKQIQDDFGEMFNDSDERNNSLFGLALAQWETKSLDPTVYKQVKEIIETGNDLKVWQGLGADEKTLKQRKVSLDKFLTQISTDREKPKRRVKPKYDFTYNELVNIISPDNKKTFRITEHFTNGKYTHTTAMMDWGNGGSGIFHFIGLGQFISACWINGQTLEVTHDKNIAFPPPKWDTFFLCGDQGKIIYKEK